MIKKAVLFLCSACLLTGCSTTISQNIPKYHEIAAVGKASALEQSTEAETTEYTEPAINTKPAELTLEVLPEVEIYTDVTMSEFISNTDITLKEPDALVNTEEIGEVQTDISYFYKGKLYRHPVEYTVSDNTPPLVLRSGDGGKVMVGSNFKLTDYVGYVDNFDRKPTLTYEGNIDPYTCGNYHITATATDQSGNSTSWDLSLSVVSEEPVYEDNNTRISFDEYKRIYADDNVSFGIDVSKWQGDIDFEAVKNAGCEYVIMRIGSYYDEYTLDKYFTSNMQKATDAGLKVGVYIYTTANTPEEIEENAQWIADNLNGQELDFPVVFDWEEFSCFQQYNMNINDLNEYFELFDEKMQEHGYSAMLYSSKNFLMNFWYEHSDYPIWLAHYTDETSYTGEYAIWQSTCFGKIDGIEGDVDFNILYKDKWNKFEN